MPYISATLDAATFVDGEIDCGDLLTIERIGGTPNWRGKITPMRLELHCDDGGKRNSRVIFDAPKPVIRAVETAFKACCCDRCGEAKPLRVLDYDGWAKAEHVCEACYTSGLEDGPDWTDFPEFGWRAALMTAAKFGLTDRDLRDQIVTSAEGKPDAA